MPSVEPVAAFINSGKRNQWLNYRNMRVYVRNALHRGPNGEYLQSFDIANVEVVENKRGRGIFRRWLDNAEAVCQLHQKPLYVEEVLSPILKGALRRRGYIEAPAYQGCPSSCFWKLPTPI